MLTNSEQGSLDMCTTKPVDSSFDWVNINMNSNSWRAEMKSRDSSHQLRLSETPCVKAGVTVSLTQPRDTQAESVKHCPAPAGLRELLPCGGPGVPCAEHASLFCLWEP